MKCLKLALIATASILAACGPSQEEVARAKLQAERDARLPKVMDATSAYFGSRVKTTWGYWDVVSVKPGKNYSFAPESNYIEVLVELPVSQAMEIMSRSSDAQFRAVGWNACPKLSDPMWRKYGPEDQLTVQASYTGTIFIDVDCREHGMP